MSTFNTTYDDPAPGGAAIARDRARELLGQVMAYVAVTVGFTALGAYLGRDLSGATGFALFIGAIPVVLGLNIAAARGREQLAIGLLFGLGLLLGLAVAPVIADYAIIHLERLLELHVSISFRSPTVSTSRASATSPHSIVRAPRSRPRAPSSPSSSMAAAASSSPRTTG